MDAEPNAVALFQALLQTMRAMRKFEKHKNKVNLGLRAELERRVDARAEALCEELTRFVDGPGDFSNNGSKTKAGM